MTTEPQDSDSPQKVDCNPRLVQRLRESCNGHPFAKIPWPHRVLHEAADEIERRQNAMTAINGYMENRLSLVKSLGAVSYVYGQNGHAKAKEISEEIARIDAIIADLVSPLNARDLAPPP